MEIEKAKRICEEFGYVLIPYEHIKNIKIDQKIDEFEIYRSNDKKELFEYYIKNMGKSIGNFLLDQKGVIKIIKYDDMETRSQVLDMRLTVIPYDPYAGMDYFVANMIKEKYNA